MTSLVARFLPGETRVETLPSHLFKWRMGVAALHFAETIEREGLQPDLLITTDMMDLSRLKGLCPRALAASTCVLIMHENQLSYPTRKADRDELHLGLTNLYSAWCADLIWWNSQHHYDLFIKRARTLVKLFPKRVPKDLIERIQVRSHVFGLPINLRELASYRPERGRPRPQGPLRLAWNHRMSFDKNPQRVFERLLRAAKGGLDFELHLFGPRHEAPPAALAELGMRAIDHGFLERSDYLQQLAACDVILADPDQEHFGLSVAEGVQLGLWPLLPKRLCYPEFVPKELWADCLFNDEAGFDRLLAKCADQPQRRVQGFYTDFEASLVIDRLLSVVGTKST